jgi:hypothetical protein
LYKFACALTKRAVAIMAGGVRGMTRVTDVFCKSCSIDRAVKMSRNGLKTHLDETVRKVMLVYWVEEECACGAYSSYRFRCAGPSVKRYTGKDGLRIRMDPQRGNSLMERNWDRDGEGSEGVGGAQDTVGLCNFVRSVRS